VDVEMCTSSSQVFHFLLDMFNRLGESGERREEGKNE
jgi:hypothetical protein